jgi:hypothetical protein
MWHKTKCRACLRPCIGRRALICLDCEDILQTIQQRGYQLGFDAAFDSSISLDHPPLLLQTQLLPIEERQHYENGYRYGFLRGEGTRRWMQDRFRRVILREFMHVLGRRRHGLLSFLGYLTHRPHAQFDPQLLKVIRSLI